MKELVLPALLENLDPLIQFILEGARESGYDENTIAELHLVAEEAMVNIINYAYEGGSGDITLTVGSGNGMFSINIKDGGKAFNPLEKEDPDITIPIEDRPIGGLGIFLIRKIMDDLAYARVDDTNILTLKKKLP